MYVENLNMAIKATRGMFYGESHAKRENSRLCIAPCDSGQSGVPGADGKHGLLEFVETHTVCVQSQPSGLQPDLELINLDCCKEASNGQRPLNDGFPVLLSVSPPKRAVGQVVVKESHICFA